MYMYITPEHQSTQEQAYTFSPDKAPHPKAEISEGKAWSTVLNEGYEAELDIQTNFNHLQAKLTLSGNLCPDKMVDVLNERDSPPPAKKRTVWLRNGLMKMIARSAQLFG